MGCMMSETASSRAKDEKGSEKRTSLEDLFVGKSRSSKGSRKIHEERIAFFQAPKKLTNRIK